MLTDLAWARAHANALGLAAPNGELDSDMHLRAAAHKPVVTAPAGRGSEEGLSERERQVLRLLATELSGPEIAGHLYISVNTLRTHTKHIFSKLDVNTRRAAVRRAADLGLL